MNTESKGWNQELSYAVEEASRSLEEETWSTKIQIGSV